MTCQRTAQFGLGQQVRHRDHAFYGLVMDVDARYCGPEGETGSLSPDQPFYSVLVIAEDATVIAYAAEEALIPADAVQPQLAQQESRWFNVDIHGRHVPVEHTLQ